jgi:hypothetical protein
MKVIIIPILKFVWAVIFTIFIAIVNVITAILYTIWDGELYKGVAFDYEEICSHDFDDCLSPYVEIPKKGQGSIYYKTYFHYIWGIKTTKRNLNL